MDVIKIINPGIYSSIQDSGRRGYRRFGMPLSGAMDPYAFVSCNRLLGNPDEYPVVEITGAGFECEFLEDTTACITGADLTARLNDSPAGSGEPFKVSKGDRLAFAGIRKGLRAYLCADGGLASGSFLGSSSFRRGERLKTDDVLHVHGDVKSNLQAEYDDSYIRADSSYTVMVTKGYDAERLRKFRLTGFTVTSYHDRMGIRLKGESAVHKETVVSKPVFPGCIQLPRSGDPIIIMNDGQTTGGYPVIAVIVQQDLRIAGQLKAGDTVKFRYV